MYRYVYGAVAALCAVGACVYFYFTFSQHFLYSIFAITGLILSKLSYDEYRRRMDSAVISQIRKRTEKIIIHHNTLQQSRLCRDMDEVFSFRKEN